MTTALANIVGGAHVRAGGPDDGICGTVPAWVARPGRVEEIQEIVRAARSAGWRLVPNGLGAHAGLGGPPERVDVLVQLDRLDRVVDHQAGDMTVTTEAGCTLPVLAATLAQAGQWLPLDPPLAGRTTVGGLVGANLSGPLRASQGTARDLVIGLRIVSGDGTVVAGGGKVVKNVAGYDLPKLHIGALGSLGIIVDVTFKVRPKPVAEAAIVVACASALDAGETALAARDVIEPYWIEAGGMRALPDGPGDGAAVIVGLGGLPEEVAAGRDALLHALRATGRRGVVVEDGGTLRAELAAFAAIPAPAVLRCATVPADVGPVMACAEQTAREHGGTARCLAHAANGVVLVAVERPAAIDAVVGALRAHVRPVGGAVVVDRADTDTKRRVGTWGDVTGAALHQGVRRALDTDGVFASGRLPAGC